MVNVLTTNLLRVKWKVVDSDRHLKTFFFLSMNLKIGPKFRILQLGQVDLHIYWSTTKFQTQIKSLFKIACKWLRFSYHFSLELTVLEWREVLQNLLLYMYLKFKAFICCDFGCRALNERYMFTTFTLWPFTFKIYCVWMKKRGKTNLLDARIWNSMFLCIA